MRLFAVRVTHAESRQTHETALHALGAARAAVVRLGRAARLAAFYGGVGH